VELHVFQTCHPDAVDNKHNKNNKKTRPMGATSNLLVLIDTGQEGQKQNTAVQPLLRKKKTLPSKSGLLDWCGEGVSTLNTHQTKGKEN